MFSFQTITVATNLNKGACFGMRLFCVLQYTFPIYNDYFMLYL